MKLYLFEPNERFSGGAAGIAANNLEEAIALAATVPEFGGLGHIANDWDDAARKFVPRCGPSAFDEAVRAARIAKHPAKRLGHPPELGNTCAFLCSVHAGYINGQNILLDGGSFAGL